MSSMICSLSPCALAEILGYLYNNVQQYKRMDEWNERVAKDEKNISSSAL